MGRNFVEIGKWWVYVVVGLIALSYLWILYTEDVWKLWETPSPFNIWNALAMLLIKGAALVLPGVALIGLGKIIGDDH